MTLGLGIFLSVLALILVWQIDKRSAWRKVGRLALWTGCLVLLGAMATGSWLYWDQWAHRRELRAEARRIQEGEVHEYQGIPLGASEGEILYRKGAPTERKDNRWVYKSQGGETQLGVLWSPDRTVASIDCQAQLSWQCDSVAGLGIGTDEQAIRDFLGQPRREADPAPDGIKGMHYGTDEFDVSFQLTRRKVYKIFVTDTKLLIATVKQDPIFLGLPAVERQKVLLHIDPAFARLSPEAQWDVVSSLGSTASPAAQAPSAATSTTQLPAHDRP
jgi:hypothetical protein